MTIGVEYRLSGMVLAILYTDKSANRMDSEHEGGLT
jgi:hypothetical protein